MAPALSELSKRRYCTYDYYGGRYCYGGSRWHNWGRWLLLGLVLLAALIALVAWFGGAMIKKRRQKAQNNQAYPQAQYEQQETYPQQSYNNEYANAGPPSGPPPQQFQGYYDAHDAGASHQNYTATTAAAATGDSKQQGDYGPPPGPPPPVAYQTHP